MMAKVLRFLISSVKLMGLEFQGAKVGKMNETLFHSVYHNIVIRYSVVSV
jgi:hypothetical protein